MPNNEPPSSTGKRAATLVNRHPSKRQRMDISDGSDEGDNGADTEPCIAPVVEDTTVKVDPHILAQAARLIKAIKQHKTVARVFIERAPESPARSGAACRLATCSDRILQNDHRVALIFRANGLTSNRATPEFYHVGCFERIADLTDPEILNLVTPLTRNNLGIRGIKPTSIFEGNYILDAATRDLSSSGKLAGSAGFAPKKPSFMSTVEFDLHATNVTAIESDGVGDSNEWNLFQTYMPSGYEKDPDVLKGKHSLSDILNHRVRDNVIVGCSEDNLSDDQRATKAAMSSKAIRAIKRLSALHLPTLSM